MSRNLDLFGVSILLYGFFYMGTGLLVVLIVTGFGGLMGVVGADTGDENMLLFGGFTMLMGAFSALTIVLMGLLPVLAGVGIRRRAPWGRALGIAASVIALLNIPIGTVVGVFGMVTLLDKRVKEEFSQ